MNNVIDTSLNKLTNAGLLLSKEYNFKQIVHLIVEEAIDLGNCDLSALYLCENPKDNSCNFYLVLKKGKYEISEEFKFNNILINFIKENRESIVLVERKENCFIDVLINQRMQSGIVLPLIKEDFFIGVLFLNSVLPYHFNREKIDILDSFIKLAGEIFNYSSLLNDLKAYFKR